MQSQSGCWSQVADLLLLGKIAKQLNLEAVNPESLRSRDKSAERQEQTVTETLYQADSASPNSLRIQGSLQPPSFKS
jgi:hypothetical protein